MNKNLKIVIGIIAVIILILVLINIFKNSSADEESIEEETTISEIQYDEETGEYYIYDEETGEILHTATSEADLYIYTIDPDYDPKLPAEDLVSDETE